MTSSLFPDERSTDQDETWALIALSLVPGVGPGRIRALLARFGSAAAAWRAPTQAIECVPSIGPQTAAAIHGFKDHKLVDEQFARARSSGASLITALDPQFPDLLKQIYDPPAFLWMRGEYVAEDRRAIAIVGTRRATEYGKRVAFEFASEMARRGFTIVSGLAYGIDAAAHRGALDAGGRTLAILGSGVDRIYPGSHVTLARSVMDHGALISEYPLGAAPDAPNFPRRNRIVSGIALGVLVVEAYETGGALITARLAVEQNREVFAIPSPVHSAAGAGCNRLIQNGHAKLVFNVEDILSEFDPATSNYEDSAPEESISEVELNGTERLLYEALESNPIHIDTLCVRTGLDPSTALVYLLSLEFKGLIRQMAGKQFYRAR